MDNLEQDYKADLAMEQIEEDEIDRAKHYQEIMGKVRSCACVQLDTGRIDPDCIYCNGKGEIKC